MAIKSAISFGLVYIPVNLSLVIKNNDIGFNMLHKKYNTRIKYVKKCDSCESEVAQSDIIKGYEYADNQYVTFDDKDFEKLKTEKDKTIQILQFCDVDEIDPIYYDKSYYLAPNGAEKAYALLSSAMTSAKKVAIAKTILGTKECLIAIRPKDNSLIMSTMFFEEEVQKNPTKDIKTPVKSSEEFKLASTIIKNMTKPFQPQDFKDEYHERLLNAIQNKIDGKKITRIETDFKPPNVINLLDALKKSLPSTDTQKVRKIK